MVGRAEDASTDFLIWLLCQNWSALVLLSAPLHSLSDSLFTLHIFFCQSPPCFPLSSLPWIFLLLNLQIQLEQLYPPLLSSLLPVGDPVSYTGRKLQENKQKENWRVHLNITVISFLCNDFYRYLIISSEKICYSYCIKIFTIWQWY